MKNRRRKKRSDLPTLPQEVKTVLKWVVYVILGVCGYLIAISGNGGSMVLYMIPLAIAVAVFEQEIPAALMGGFLGLLTDMAADKLLGFTAFYLCIMSGLVSALFRQLMRKNIFNFAWVYLIAGGIYLYLDYYFFYAIWSVEGYEQVFRSVMLPSAVKTYLLGFISYLTVCVTKIIFSHTKRLTIEELSPMVDRL